MLRFLDLDQPVLHLRLFTRVGQGEKPFACTHCTKRFNRKWALVVHLRTHKVFVSEDEIAAAAAAGASGSVVSSAGAGAGAGAGSGAAAAAADGQGQGDDGDGNEDEEDEAELEADEAEEDIDGAAFASLAASLAPPPAK